MVIHFLSSFMVFFVVVISEITLILFQLLTSFFRQLLLYRERTQQSNGEYVSLVLKLVDEKIACDKLLVRFMLRIRNQNSRRDITGQTSM